MVRGLVVRQAIRAADAILIVLLGVVAYNVALRFMEQPTLTQTTESAVELPTFELAQVGDRAEYDRIIESGLFGNAGSLSAPEGPVEPVVAVDEVETQLPLRLFGTAATVNVPLDPMSNAIIENRAARTTEKVATYQINDEIMEGVTLLEVHPRRVKLLNALNSPRRHEWLSQEEASSPAGQPGVLTQAAQAAINRNAQPQSLADAKMITLPQQETYQEMMGMDYAQTINSLRPQMEYDENDNVVGISSQYFEDIPLAQKTGFVNGDVITEVNGVAIDSQERVPEILMENQGATSVRIRLLRNGTPMVKTIRLE